MGDHTKAVRGTFHWSGRPVAIETLARPQSHPPSPRNLPAREVARRSKSSLDLPRVEVIRRPRRRLSSGRRRSEHDSRYLARDRRPGDRRGGRRRGVLTGGFFAFERARDFKPALRQNTSMICSPPCSGLPIKRWPLGSTTQSSSSRGICPIKTGNPSPISPTSIAQSRPWIVRRAAR